MSLKGHSLTIPLSGVDYWFETTRRVLSHVEVCGWHDHLKNITFLWGKSFTRCCFNTYNWLKEYSLQLSPTKCRKRTSRKFLKITFHHLSLRLYLTGWYSTELSMQKYSAYEEWWSQVEQSYKTGNFYTAGSCISLIIISHLWIEIDMDFSIAPASNNMLFNHKNAMCFSVWNKQSIWWMDGWMNWLNDWLNGW